MAKPLISSFPKTHLLNPEFAYRNSAHTSLQETFKRERERLESQRPNIIYLPSKVSNG